MADQCIVCLDDLAVATPRLSANLSPSLVAADNVTATVPADPSNIHLPSPIALIKACGHILHDECLREWIQKANSCPICRTAFHSVDVYDKVGGKFPSASPLTFSGGISPFIRPRSDGITQANFSLPTMSKTRSKWRISTLLPGLMTKWRRLNPCHAPSAVHLIKKTSCYSATAAMHPTTRTVLA